MQWPSKLHLWPPEQHRLPHCELTRAALAVRVVERWPGLVRRDAKANSSPIRRNRKLDSMNAPMVGATLRHGKVYSLSLSQKLVRLRGMESGLDYHTARALLEWQIELGATDAIGDEPVDRYALPDTSPKAKKPAIPAQNAPAKAKQVDAGCRRTIRRRKLLGRWISCVPPWTRLIFAT